MSMICFGICVFLKKINNPFGVSPFFSGKVSISIGRETLLPAEVNGVLWLRLALLAIIFVEKTSQQQ